MVLTGNDKQTIELILTNLKGKEKLSDEEKLFKRFYEEYQNSNGGLSRDGQKFIRAFIKDFRYQQKREKERLKQQYVLSKEQKAKRKAEANRRLVNGMCVTKAQDSFGFPYFFELFFATIGVMNENDQKKLNMRLGKYGYRIEEQINEEKLVIYELLFLKVVDKKNVFLPVFDLDSEWIKYYHRIKTFDQIDANGKKQYKFEMVKSRGVSTRKGLFSEIIKEAIERYHRKKAVQENIEKTKQNLTLETL